MVCYTARRKGSARSAAFISGSVKAKQQLDIYFPYVLSWGFKGSVGLQAMGGLDGWMDRWI